MIPRDLHFIAFDKWIHVFWLLPLALLFYYAFRTKKTALDTLIDPALQPKVVYGDFIKRDFLFFLFFSLGWIFAVIALMQPVGNAQYDKTYKTHTQSIANLYFLIDTSLSMSVKDAGGDKARLARALEIADLTLKQLKNRAIALVGVSGGAHTVVPLTFDPLFIRLILREVDYNEGDSEGTDFIDLIRDMEQEIKESHHAENIALFFSDGGDTKLDQASEEEKKKIYYEMEQALRNFEELQWITIGVGSVKGGVIPNFSYEGKEKHVSLEEEPLKVIASASGGKYLASENRSSEEVADEIIKNIERIGIRGKNRSFAHIDYKHYFQIPLLIALFSFFIAYLSTPMAAKKHLFFVLLFSSLQAMEDRGASFAESGDLESAVSWYQEELMQLPPEWLQDKLFYNLATIQALESQYERALHSFNAISSKGFTFPIFLSRLFYNISLTLYQEGLSERDFNRFDLLVRSLIPLRLYQLSEGQKEAEEIEPLLLAIGKALEESPTFSSLSEKTFFFATTLLSQFENPHPRQVAFVESLFPKKTAKEIRRLFEEAKKESGKWQSLHHLILHANVLQAKTPEEILQALSQEAITYSQADEKELSEQLLQDASRFYPLLASSQKKGFQEGKCQCSPWQKVVPSFYSGLNDLRGGQNQPLVKNAQRAAYWKWQEALQAFNSMDTSSQKQENQDNDDLKDLEEMQKLDRETRASQKPHSLGEKPW